MVVGLAELLQELRKHGLSLAFCSLQVRGTRPRWHRAGPAARRPLRSRGRLSPAARPAWHLQRGCCCFCSGGTFISERWRLQHLSAAAGHGAAGKGCVPCPRWLGGHSPGWRGRASSRIPQPWFLCPQDPVLQVLLSADLEGFQHFRSREEAGEALGCPRLLWKMSRVSELCQSRSAGWGLQGPGSW